MASPVSKNALWSGRVLSAIPSLMILFGSVVKFMRGSSVIEGFQRSGMPERLILTVALTELTCVVVYLIPKTSVLGAILMTGLLGGATITSLRIGDPTFPVPVILGMMAWGGLFLRDTRLRALIPLRRPQEEDQN
jgi:DoxX-like family